jgi:hypothetical protein
VAEVLRMKGLKMGNGKFGVGLSHNNCSKVVECICIQ